MIAVTKQVDALHIGEVHKILPPKDHSKMIHAFIKGIYENEFSWIREIISNAVDAKGNQNVKVSYVESQPMLGIGECLVIQDFGYGMSYDFIVNTYSILMETTKDQSNEYIGSHGVGRLSPLKYTPTFYVETIKDGEKTVFSVGETSTEDFVINIFDCSDTTESNGTKVIVPTDKSDKYSIQQFIGNYIALPKIDYEGLHVSSALNNAKEYKTFFYVKGSYTSRLWLEGLIYNSSIGLSSRIIPKFKIGELQPTKSREHIDFSFNKELVESRVKEIYDEINGILDPLDLKKVFLYHDEMLSILPSNNIYKILDNNYVRIESTWRTKRKRYARHKHIFSHDTFYCVDDINTLKLQDLREGIYFKLNELRNNGASEDFINRVKSDMNYIEFVAPQPKERKVREQSEKVYRKVDSTLDDNRLKQDFSITNYLHSDTKYIYGGMEDSDKLLEIARKLYFNIVAIKVSKDRLKELKANPNCVALEEATDDYLINIAFCNHIMKYFFDRDWLGSIFPLEVDKWSKFKRDWVEVNITIFMKEEFIKNNLYLESYDKHPKYPEFKLFTDFIDGVIGTYQYNLSTMKDHFPQISHVLTKLFTHENEQNKANRFE